MLSEDVSTSRRVLIVEDEPLLAMNLEDMLTELGHVVTAIATRLDEAIELAEDKKLNLAFLDINLAGSNSFEVADILLKRKIPFIFTSGYGKDGLVEGYRQAKMLTKPFSVKELQNMIAQTIASDVI